MTIPTDYAVNDKWLRVDTATREYLYRIDNIRRVVLTPGDDSTTENLGIRYGDIQSCDYFYTSPEDPDMLDNIVSALVTFNR